MNIQQFTWHPTTGWIGDETPLTVKVNKKSQWVLYFGPRESLENDLFFKRCHELYPDAQIMGCTTGGTITKADVLDDVIYCTAIEFEATTVVLESYIVTAPEFSYNAGMSLASLLNKDKLQGIFILADGININGSELVRGFKSIIGPSVPISGGLASEVEKFDKAIKKKTLISCNGVSSTQLVAAIGFYGDNLSISCGSAGGWEYFGPERLITKSEGNILYELDGRPALDIYSSYLGDQAKNLPISALLFPLAIKSKDSSEEVLRTILAIDNEKKSLTFAGDMPQGFTGRLMHSSNRQLVEGAGRAAQKLMLSTTDLEQCDFSILVSCVGRRLLLGQRSFEEVDSVLEILGDKCKICGFYSYGEISPLAFQGSCHLLNQTMSIVGFSEKTNDEATRD